MRKTGSCCHGGFSQAGRGTNCSWHPLIMYIHAHGPKGVQRRDRSLLKRGMFRNIPLAERTEGRIGRKKCDRLTGQKWSSGKDQGTERANAWKLKSGQDSLGVTLSDLAPPSLSFSSPTSLLLPPPPLPSSWGSIPRDPWPLQTRRGLFARPCPHTHGIKDGQPMAPPLLPFLVCHLSLPLRTTCHLLQTSKPVTSGQIYILKERKWDAYMK